MVSGETGEGLPELWSAIWRRRCRGPRRAGGGSPRRERGEVAPRMAVNKLPSGFAIDPCASAISTRSWRSSGSPSSRRGRPRCFSRRCRATGPTWTCVRDQARRKVVAFGNYWLVADEVHLLNLATHAEERRAGHASRLLAHIVEFGRGQALPPRHPRGAAVERRRAPALPPVRLQGGGRSTELLRRGSGRRRRDAPGPRLR